MSKNVFIAESNKFLFEVLLESLPHFGFTVVGTTSKIPDLEALILKTKPDLLIVDFHLSKNAGLNNFKNISKLKKQLPEMKIVVTGIHEAVDHFIKYIRNSGFDGFWNKYEKPTDFFKMLSLLFA